MKIYTKTGDDGTTGLYGGGRVTKDHPRIEACGTVDELNATIGMARAHALPPEVERALATIQHQLFDLGAELGRSNRAADRKSILGAAAISAMESSIDVFEARLAPLKNFILPAGTPAAATLHLARTVCRRAERRVFTLAEAPDANIDRELLVYLNRLGDFLFVLARVVNVAAGQGDVPWRPGAAAQE
jgi:cob(I)alamin adenosyltransferase